MATRECCVCGDENQGDMTLLELPCGKHYICPNGNDSDDCLLRFFQQALDEERNYPVKCCESVMNIRDYEGIINWDFLVKFLAKEIEYGTHPRFRKYCANANCAAFLYPETHEIGSSSFAKCNACPAITCLVCSSLLFYKDTTLPSSVCPNNNPLNTSCANEKGRRCASCQSELEHLALHHTCNIPEEDRKFKLHAKEQGYQECHNCGSTVELMEACNHIVCGCGHEFCYVCGKMWEGLHGCPQYGAADYDAEGFNQDGFHRDTGLNRDGLTRRQMQQGHDGDTEEDTDDEDEGGQETVWDVFREVVDRMDQDTIAVLTAMDPEARWEALEQERIRMEEDGELEQQEQGGDQTEEDAEGGEGEEGEDAGGEQALVEEEEDSGAQSEPEPFEMDALE
ncbi:hypothetical protein K491DRAFT_270639 [Lophiostoma macrostomum CBS 122681]|uniref:RBR-type E3 ubiquitin transferase n=1 Tax=Lophiostoma macrostomum CBS 122681 TaxID=1314788 RepID=A0A6A6TFH2_9PLEO|nr:hypothetical protein K491DRAFT_270639 [Lophiostoma macrostomum CBS 122681]